jgi:hypothetical protein
LKNIGSSNTSKMTNTSTAFNQNTIEYDQWFEKHLSVYQSEILAIQQVIPENKTGIEIGVGTGRFAAPLRAYPKTASWLRTAANAVAVVVLHRRTPEGASASHALATAFSLVLGPTEPVFG